MGGYGRPATSLVLTAAAGIGLALFAAYQLIAILGGSAGSHAVEAFVFTAAAVVGLAVMGYLSVHHEHQLRSAASQMQVVSVSPTTDETASLEALPRATSVWPRRGGISRQGPIAKTIVIVIFAAFAVGLVVETFVVYGHGQRSHRTQTDGVPSRAVVNYVHHVEHTGKYDTWYTAEIHVTLPDGTPSVVHDPDDSFLDYGDTIDVLSDPKDPSYSELPGQSDTPRYTWLALVGFAIFVAFIAMWTAIVIPRRKRRALLASAAATSTPSPT